MEAPSAKGCSRLQQFGLERLWHFRGNIYCICLYVYIILYFLGPLSVPSLTGICPTRRQQKHLLCCFFVRFKMNFSPSFLRSRLVQLRRGPDAEMVPENQLIAAEEDNFRCQRPEVFVPACWKHIPRVVFFLLKNNKNSHEKCGQFWWGVV